VLCAEDVPARRVFGWGVSIEVAKDDALERGNSTTRAVLSFITRCRRLLWNREAHWLEQGVERHVQYVSHAAQHIDGRIAHEIVAFVAADIGGAHAGCLREACLGHTTRIAHLSNPCAIPLFATGSCRLLLRHPARV